jgi:hypothetical protein
MVKYPWCGPTTGRKYLEISSLIPRKNIVPLHNGTEKISYQ